MITATYDPADNKIRIRSLARLDKETYQRVRDAGFIWAPKQELFVAPMWTPSRADLAMELADSGELDDEDTSLVDRAEQRAERFEDYSDSRAKDADRARNAVKQIADNIPFGQPILIGHHSERHARRDAEKIENGMRKAVKMWETSQYWQQRAKGALMHAKYKELPAVRARRIKGLLSEQRKQQKYIAHAEKMITIWETLHDDATTIIKPKEGSWSFLDRARWVTGHLDCHVNVLKQEAPLTGWWDAWDVLRSDEDRYKACPAMAPEDVQQIVIDVYQRSIARHKRWLDHYTFRLEYERAMLEEAGASNLLDKKPRRELLPICNYREPGGIDMPNLYHRGEMIHYPQVEMTQAEYADINQDYRHTRVADGSHRVRVAMIKHALVCVFLTDSKVHARPAPAAAKVTVAPPMMAMEKEPETRAPAKAQDAPSSDFEAMRATLRAGGVQVVSAPQLFPTPPEIAARMVEEANIQPGETVLEPSAGTGNLVRAVIDSVDTEIVAYEINQSLVSALERTFPSYKLQTRCRDFLEVTEGQGQFPVVIMNPPFKDGADIQHIKHAMTFLRPGGRLVALCANGPRQNAQLIPLVEEHGGTWEVLPEGSFSSQGTSVNVAMLSLSLNA